MSSLGSPLLQQIYIMETVLCWHQILILHVMKSLFFFFVSHQWADGGTSQGGAMKTARCCNTGRNCLILRFLNLRHIFPKMSDSQPVFFLPNLATHCCHANLFFFFFPLRECHICTCLYGEALNY